MPVDEALDVALDAAVEETVSADEAREGIKSSGEDEQTPDVDSGNKTRPAQQDDAGAGEQREETDDGDESQGDGEGEAEGKGEGESEGGADDGDQTPAPKPARQEALLSDEAIAAAIGVGIPASAALRFGSDEELYAAANGILDKHAPDSGDDEEVNPLAGLPELDPEKYNPEVLETLQAFKDQISKQNDELSRFREEQAQIAQDAQNSNLRDVRDWFDRKVAGLGGDFEEALGKGGISDQEPGSSQYAKRDAIGRHMAILMAGYESQGVQPPSQNELFDAAVQVVLKDDLQTMGTKKLTGKLQRRSRQHISRATGGSKKKSTDPETDIAAEIDEQFFSKR